MIEEPLGPYERKLLLLNKGSFQCPSNNHYESGAAREEVDDFVVSNSMLSASSIA